jgi:hypothetical protein
VLHTQWSWNIPPGTKLKKSWRTKILWQRAPWCK